MIVESRLVLVTELYYNDQSYALFETSVDLVPMKASFDLRF